MAPTFVRFYLNTNRKCIYLVCFGGFHIRTSKISNGFLIDEPFTYRMPCECGGINISKSWEFNYGRVQRFGVHKERRTGTYWRLQSKQTNKQSDCMVIDFDVCLCVRFGEWVPLSVSLYRPVCIRRWHFLYTAYKITLRNSKSTFINVCNMHESTYRNYRLNSNIKSSFHTWVLTKFQGKISSLCHCCVRICLVSYKIV